MLNKKESMSLRIFYNKAAVWVYCDSSLLKNKNISYFRISREILNDVKRILGNDNYHNITCDLHEIAYFNKKERQKKFHIEFDEILKSLNISKQTWNYKK